MGAPEITPSRRIQRSRPRPLGNGRELPCYGLAGFLSSSLHQETAHESRTPPTTNAPPTISGSTSSACCCGGACWFIRVVKSSCVEPSAQGAFSWTSHIPEPTRTVHELA